MYPTSLVFTIYKFKAKLRVEKIRVKEKENSKMGVSSYQFSVFHLFSSFPNTELSFQK